MNTTRTSLHTTVGSQNFTVPPSHLLITFAALAVLILVTFLVLGMVRWVIQKTQATAWLRERAADWLPKIEAAQWVPAKLRRRLASLLEDVNGRYSATVNEEVH